MKRVSLESRSKGRVPQIREQLVQLGRESRGAQQSWAAAVDAPRAIQAAGGVEGREPAEDVRVATVAPRPVLQTPQATPRRLPVDREVKMRGRVE